MKILAGGDFHGDPKNAALLAARAVKENVDVVILCGDITDSDATKGAMIKPFLDAGKKVLFVPGNHDSPATSQFLTDFYDVVNLENNSFSLNDIGIFGFGSVNCGINQVSDLETLNSLAKGFEQVKGLKKKIMVSHTHPSRTNIEKFSNFVIGSDAVRHAIEYFEPDIHLCSHVHEAQGMEEKIGKTRVINVGPKGEIIEV